MTDYELIRVVASDCGGKLVRIVGNYLSSLSDCIFDCVWVPVVKKKTFCFSSKLFKFQHTGST